MIIDTESHVIYRLFPRDTNPERKMTFRPTWHEFNGDLFAAEMERAGVDHAFLISYDAEDILWYLTKVQGATMEDCIAGRKYTLQAVKRHPDKFLWFATLKDPRREDIDALMKVDLDEGVLGFKIFPAYYPLALDDPALMRVYRACAEANRRVILSFEDPIPPETPSFEDYFQQLDRVLGAYPSLKFQVNHAGCVDPLGPEAHGILGVVKRHENVMLSCAYLGMVWDDGWEYPYARYLARLKRLRDEVGIAKLAWATDWPWLEEFFSYPQAVDAVRKHADFLNPTEMDQFLGLNAWRFVEELVCSQPAALGHIT